MSWSQVANVVEGGLNLVSAFQSNRAARQARDTQNELIDAELDRVRYVQNQYAEGGDKLAATLQLLLDNYGQFGQVSPDYVSEMSRYFADNRAEEQAGRRATIDDMTAADLDRLRQLERGGRLSAQREVAGRVDPNRFLAEARIPAYANPNRELGEARIEGYEAPFRSFAARVLAATGGDVETADAAARAAAPDTLDFAALQDELTARFASLRGENTRRALRNQYAKAMTSVPPGMGNSTLRVQLERSMADLSAERANQDLLAAVGDAQKYIQGLQAAATNQQGMELKERDFVRMLGNDAVTRSGQTLDTILAGGEYGMNLGEAINEAGWRGGTYGMELADLINRSGWEGGRFGIDVGEAINRAGWTGGQYGITRASEENALRGRAIDEMGAFESLPSDTAYRDYLRGLEFVGVENELAAGFLDQMAAITKAPYSFRATGATNATYGTALDGATRAYNSAQQLASSNMAGLGDWWRTYRDTENF